jgi:hypothetical protein
MFRWMTIILISFVLTGCTMISFTYFRNLTSQPVVLKYYSQREYSYQHKPTTVDYQNEILPIKKSTWKHLKDSLPIVYNGSEARIVLPARSTVLIPRRGYYDSMVVLSQAELTDTIKIFGLSKSANRFQNKTVGFPVSWIYYYDLQTPLNRQSREQP